jgi:hypothetical protein
MNIYVAGETVLCDLRKPIEITEKAIHAELGSLISRSLRH